MLNKNIFYQDQIVTGFKILNSSVVNLNSSLLV